MLNHIKLIAFTCLFFTFSACQSENSQITPDQDSPALIELSGNERLVSTATNEFSFELLKKVSQEEGNTNIVISPFSASMALGMAMNGAVGDTQDDLLETLGFTDINQEEANKAYQGLINILDKADNKVTFNQANSIWFKSNLEVKGDFKEAVTSHFDAEVSPFELSTAKATINNWVEDKTEGKIKDLIQEVTGDHVMFLINAIYFKAPWKYEFDKEMTRKEFFQVEGGQNIDVDMMVAPAPEYLYGNNNQVEIYDLPYGDGRYSMTVLVPQNGKTISQIIEVLNSSNLSEWLNNANTTTMELQMPRFKIEFKAELKELLASMGNGLAFSSKADFTHLFKNPRGDERIDKVTQKAFIEVTEEGTEAAAATSVGFVVESMPEANMINRSFIFLIREKATNSVLFSGTVYNPAE